MATKVKPCRVNATWTPQVWDVPVYVDADTFQWWSGWWWGTVAFSNILGDPYDNTNLSNALADKQDELVSGVNIRTINWTSVLWSWDIVTPVWWSDIEYVTQAEYNALLPWALTDNKHYFIYSTSGGGWWQPWVNTLAYYPLDSINTVNDLSWNNHTLTNNWITFWTYNWVDCAYNAGSNYMTCDLGSKISDGSYTLNVWAYKNWGVREIYVMMFWVWTTYSATCMQRGSSWIINYACWFDDISTISTYPTWAWTNIVFTYNKDTRAKHIYVNWVDAASWTGNASYNLAEFLVI